MKLTKYVLPVVAVAMMSTVVTPAVNAMADSSLSFVVTSEDEAEMFSSSNGDAVVIAKDGEKVEFKEEKVYTDEERAFMDMQDSIAGFFNTQRDTEGVMHGMLALNKDGLEVSHPSLYTALSNGMTADVYNDLQGVLGTYASSLYKDIKGDEWYASSVVLPTYFGVLNGYADGTILPENYITPAEVVKIVCNTFEYGVEKSADAAAWYTNYYNKMSKAFTYTDLEQAGVAGTYMDNNYQMKRCEIAYVIANIISGKTGELESYVSKARNWDIGTLASFDDVGLMSVDDNGTYAKDMEIMNNGYIPSRYAGALSYLHDKGVLTGDDDNGDGVYSMRALSPVSRAEVFTLMNRVCAATKSYDMGMFSKEEKVVKGSAHYDTSDSPRWSFRESWQWVEDYNEWQSRAPMVLRADDVTRETRAIKGDTFIALDGTEYKLEGSGIFMGDGKTEILGVGLPIAVDLGRQRMANGRLFTVADDGDAINIQGFGWQDAEVPTCGSHYIVFDATGEGHWEDEWSYIASATKPKEKGYDGQVTDNGYWKYIEEFSWIWMVN